MDPTQDPAAIALTDPDQNAVDSALNAYNQASANFNYWQQKLTDLQNDPKAATTDQTTASQQADSARTQLQAAARDYSNLLGQVARSREASARSAKDPNEQRLWLNEADRAQSQSDLYKAESSLYGAKTEADIAKAQADSQAALSRATSVAARVQSQNDASQAQALLARTKAAQVPALTQSTLDLHNSTIQRNTAYVSYLNSRTAVSGSQVDLNEAKATFISGPQADAMVAQGQLRQAEADWIKQKGGATLAELQARAGKDDAAAGLSDARVLQIKANIGKSQVLPYTDRTSPNLTVFQPSTGQVSGVPNPGYVNQTLQGITDTNQAIDAISQQIANGQMDPSTGSQLIENMRQALQYKALGVTPDQYIQAQNQQAQLGMNVLGKYQETLGQGQTAANQFMNLASKVRGAVPQVSPFSTFAQVANNLYGPDIQKAQQLIQQVTPVTDKFSALKNIAILSQAKQALTGGQSSAPGQPTSPNQAPAPAGAPASDQPPPNPTVPQGLPANVPSNYPGGYQGAPYPPFESGGNP